MLDALSVLKAHHEAQQDTPWLLDHDTTPFNIGCYLPARAAERPFQKALIQPQGYDHLGRRMYSHLTFAQLEALCNAYAHGLKKQGFKRGDRVIMMVSQGLELIALTYALFKMGVVPVMIDPGMGVKSFLSCVRSIQPTGFIGIPLAHALKMVFRSAFKTVDKSVITQKKWWSGAHGLSEIADFKAGVFELESTTREELAAILFTSGSTGPPKGVQYTHGIFDGQVKAIGQMYNIEPGEIEVPAFPLFSLFSIALGMTCVIPDMDPTKPAQINPHHMVEAILDHGATTAFGSPAVWDRVAYYCKENDIKLPTLKRILTAGAPINPVLMKMYQDILNEGVYLHTPYGATECLPVASISSGEVLSQTDELTKQGKGLCVGRPVSFMDVAVIEIDDDPIEKWADAKKLESHQIGEICVRGPVATRAYENNPKHNALAKIKDTSHGEDGFWHRMGDVGYLDDDGRLWYCGRKSHRVETPTSRLLSIACEAVFNQHPEVFRSALIGLGERGQQRPVIILELRTTSASDQSKLRRDILEMAQQHELTNEIKDVLFYPEFPVDRRHNAKIHRPELAQWAAKQNL